MNESAAFHLTKSAYDPKCGLKTAMFSGRTIYVIAPLHLLKIKRSLLASGRDHDNRRFAASFAKFACAAQNAELSHRPDLGKLDQASKNNVPLIKDSRAKALYKGVLVARVYRNANDRTSSRASAHLI